MTIQYLPDKLPSIIDRIKEGVFLPQFFQLIHTSKYDEIFPETRLALEILPLHDIDYDDGEYILRRYVKKVGLLTKMKKSISYITWKLGNKI